MRGHGRVVFHHWGPKSLLKSSQDGGLLCGKRTDKIYILEKYFRVVEVEKRYVDVDGDGGLLCGRASDGAEENVEEVEHCE